MKIARNKAINKVIICTLTFLLVMTTPINANSLDNNKMKNEITKTSTQKNENISPDIKSESINPSASTTIESSGENGNTIWVIYKDGNAFLRPKDNSDGQMTNDRIDFGYGKRETLTIENGVKLPDDSSYLFSDFSFKEIVFNNDTSNVTNMSFMFAYSNLRNIIFNTFDTSNVTDMSYMFYHSSLKQASNEYLAIDLSKFDTSKVENMSYMFAELATWVSESPKRLDLQGFNTENVTNMEGMFANSKHLNEIKGVFNLDTRNVRNMSRMFEMTELAHYDMTNIDASQVEDMSYMFMGIDGYYINGKLIFPTVDFGPVGSTKFDTSKVKNMKGLFQESRLLLEADLRAFNTISVTDMSNMFWGATNLEKVDVSSFNTENVTDMSYMFAGSLKLNSLDLSNFKTTSLTNMSGMFSSLMAIEHIDLSGFNTENVTDMSMLFYQSSRLKTVNLDGLITDKVTTMKGMFGVTMDLEQLDISSFNTENVTDMSSMFRATKKLTSLDVSHFDTSNVETMASMFEEMYALKELDVTNFDTRKVTSMASMFKLTKELKSIDVTQFVTDNVTDMSGMFAHMSLLTELDYQNFYTKNVTNYSYMFAGLENVEHLDTSNIFTDVATDLSNMFSNTKKIKQLDVSHFVTNNVTDMYSMFSGMESLETIDVSSFDTENVNDIGYMFKDMKSIKNLDLSNFKTPNIYKMSYMFDGMSSLEHLDISNITNPYYADNIDWMYIFTNLDNLLSINLNPKVKFDFKAVYQHNYKDPWVYLKDRNKSYNNFGDLIISRGGNYSGVFVKDRDLNVNFVDGKQEQTLIVPIGGYIQEQDVPAHEVNAKKKFIHWNTKDDGSGSVFDPTKDMIVDHTKVYSIYTTDTYSVSYESIGDTTGILPIDSKLYFETDKVVVLDGTHLKRTGYDFIGWEYDGNVYQPGDEITVKKSNIKFVAQWIENDDFETTPIQPENTPDKERDKTDKEGLPSTGINSHLISSIGLLTVGSLLLIVKRKNEKH